MNDKEPLFDKSNAHLLDVFLAPFVKELAYLEAHEVYPSLKAKFEGLFDDFLENAQIFLHPYEAYHLNENSREALIELCTLTEKFREDHFYKSGDEDLQSLMHHPDLGGIQQKAKAFLAAIEPIIQARQQIVIKTELIPSLEKLVNLCEPDREKKYVYMWLTEDFYERSRYFLTTSRGSLNAEQIEILLDLTKKIESFDDTAHKEKFTEDVVFIRTHPDWIKIQHQALEFLEILKNDSNSSCK